MDDNGLVWFMFAKNIITRLKEGGQGMTQHRSLMIQENEENERNRKDITYPTDPQLDIKQKMGDVPSDRASQKMYKLMNDHYYGLKVKLGLAEADEEVDDILNDPIPNSERFSQEVIEQMKRKGKMVKSNRKLTAKSKDQDQNVGRF
jgi:hypothetical protein